MALVGELSANQEDVALPKDPSTRVGLAGEMLPFMRPVQTSPRCLVLLDALLHAAHLDELQTATLATAR